MKKLALLFIFVSFSLSAQITGKPDQHLYGVVTKTLSIGETFPQTNNSTIFQSKIEDTSLGGEIANTFFDIERSTNPTGSGYYYGAFKRITRSGTDNETGTKGLDITVQKTGNFNSTVLYGQDLKTTLTGGGTTSFVIGQVLRVKALGTETLNVNGVVRAQSADIEINNPNYTGYIQTMHPTLELKKGNITGGEIIFMDFDIDSSDPELNVTGDLTYLAGGGGSDVEAMKGILATNGHKFRFIHNQGTTESDFGGIINYTAPLSSYATATNKALTNIEYIESLNYIGGTGTTNYLQKATAAGTIGDSQVFDNGTNVGIGTVNPINTLDLGKTTNQAISITSSTNNKAYVAAWQDNLILGVNRNPSSGAYQTTSKGAGSIGISSSVSGSSISLSTSNTVNSIPTNRVEITKDGNVGIGTNTPTAKLDVSGQAKFSDEVFSNVTNAQIDAAVGTVLVTRDYLSGLEAIDEGNGIGWRFIGTDPANYGNIGFNAVDLGASDSASSTKGATGSYSFNSGANGTASGAYSFNSGLNGLSSSRSSFNSGNLGQATGSYSFNSARFGYAPSLSETNMGAFSTIYTPVSSASFIGEDRLFNIGNGTGDTNRSNAVTILKNGKTGIGYDNFETTTSDALLQVNGSIESTDSIILKDTQNTNRYRITVVNGVLTTTLIP